MSKPLPITVVAVLKSTRSLVRFSVAVVVPPVWLLLKPAFEKPVALL